MTKTMNESMKQLNADRLRTRTASMPPRDEPHRPAGDSAFVCGMGSVGRPLVQRLATLDIAHVTLVDFKRYSPISVETQCDPSDVGQWKVDVVESMVQSPGWRRPPTPQTSSRYPTAAVRDRSLLISCAR